MPVFFVLHLPGHVFPFFSLFKLPPLSSVNLASAGFVPERVPWLPDFFFFFGFFSRGRYPFVFIQSAAPDDFFPLPFTRMPRFFSFSSASFPVFAEACLMAVVFALSSIFFFPSCLRTGQNLFFLFGFYFFPLFIVWE